MNPTKKEIQKLQAALVKANEVVDFYSSEDNWEPAERYTHDMSLCAIKENDESVVRVSGNDYLDRAGGKLARQAKKEIAEILKEEK